MLTDQLEAAFLEWVDILGSAHVVCGEAERQSAETATFLTSQQIPAILKPADKHEAAACLEIAGKHRVPVYPISSGKNWGYGSRVPPQTGSVLLDLSRMNRILDFNEELAYVTVEPGVTQGQLYRFLQERNSRLWMDATGSSPDCSLVGNTMERGFGHTPYGDHAAHVCGLEVLLADGSFLQTGSARLPGSTTGPLTRSGLGPSLDGLFTQSNLGIVTAMTIWLMPAPEAFAAFFYRCEDEARFPDVIDALRSLRLREVLRSAIHIANDYKVLGGLRQYPWEETGGKTPLTPDVMQRFRKDLTFGFWNASGGLYGTPAQVKESKRVLQQALAPLGGRLKFVDERLLRIAKRFSKPFKAVTGWDIGRTAELVQPVIGLMRGVPTEQPLASAYWRKRTPPPTNPDPDRDRCGLLWYAPMAPATGLHLERVTGIARDTMLAHGFEPLISLTLISPRMANCVISITYDRDLGGEDERAMACYREMSEKCEAAGYYPYRLGIASELRGGEGVHAEVVRKLKEAVDPAGIIAPGRYDI